MSYDLLIKNGTVVDGTGGKPRRADVAIAGINADAPPTKTYLDHVMGERGEENALRARVKTAGRDVRSLADHIGYLSAKITFLLEATLGMINNEQNAIIKIFSVLAVALMPPTLVGTICGMNFKHMPQLEWAWGYPWALALMVVSAVLPWMYFKRKGRL